VSHARPEYVHRIDLRGSLQPFRIFGNYMWSFVFPADLTCLERLVHSTLNCDPSGRIAYTPYLPYVMFGFSALDFVQAATPPFSECGGGYEYELAIWVPVRRRGSLTPMLFTPYIFVNNPLAVLQGREIFGFPKEMAWLHKNRWPDRFPVDAFVASPRRGRVVRHWTPVVSVERVARGPKEERHWQSFEQAASELRGRLIAAALPQPLAALSPLLGSLWPPNAPLVFRKEFRDPVHGRRRPSYLGIIESEIRVKQVQYGYILSDQYLLRIPPRSSRSLADDLGLRDGTPAVLAYEMQFDFELTSGSEVWRAPAAGDRRPPASLLAQLGDLAAGVTRTIVDLGVAAAQNLVAASLAKPHGGGTVAPAPGRRRRRRKEKIVILGGGVGAMAAAFSLTEAPGWQERYEISIYQLGWRLGGKGASGRDASHHQRIEEHGIHVWFGFYENAFRLIRRCFRELPEVQQGSYEDPILWGFTPHDPVVLMQKATTDGWTPIGVPLPRRPGWPGEDDAQVPSAPHEYAREIVEWLLSSLLYGDGVSNRLAEVSDQESLVDADWAAVRARLGDRHEGRHPLNLLAAAANLAASDMAWGEYDGPDYRLLRGMLDRVARWVAGALGDVASLRGKERDVWILVDLAVTVVKGMLADGVLFGGFDILNDQDYATWLAKHGAHPQTIASEWVRAIYSQAFSFEAGDINRGRAATGTVLRGMARMALTYRHSFMFRMNSAMGDIIFAPLYRVLKERGVQFHFFHRARELRLSRDRRSIERILIGRQATPHPDYPYLTKVKDLWCWPKRPDYSKLEEGEELLELIAAGEHINFESAWSAWGPEREDVFALRAGKDFDRVILGIPVASLSHLCPALIEAHPRWREMVSTIKTVRTQAFQLWLDRPIDETGWPSSLTEPNSGGNPPVHGPILTAFVEPLDTWGDMTHTLSTEDWPPAHRPQQIAYFCGVMRDSENEPDWYQDKTFAPRMKEEAFQEMRRFLENDVHHLWPRLASAGRFDWSSLVDTKNGQGLDRLRDQFVIANIDPSERYVMSLPGTIAARIRSEGCGFENLYLAGDWTYNGLNAGCVEAAVMSGMRVAAAIGGWPERIIGEEHLAPGSGPGWVDPLPAHLAAPPPDTGKQRARRRVEKAGDR
jgi:uncharacterized protein with NAD-binding domain and iron-sulfur cluster